MELFKTKRKYIISFSLLILLGLIFLTINSFNVKAISENDLNYTFEKNSLYSSTDPIDSSFNTREYEIWEDTGHYPATYSFEDDEIGGNPLGFILYEEGGTINVISEYQSHLNVLELYDNSDTDWIYTNNNFNINYTDIIFEFWININRITSTSFAIYTFEGETNTNTIYFNNNDILWNDDGTPTNLKLDCIVVDTWYHVKIVLNDTLNQFDFYLNSILEGDNCGYRNPSTTGTNKIRYATHGGFNDWSIYLDAIGYSWDNGYTGEYFDVGVQDVLPRGITWDNINFWIVGGTNKEVYKYYANGTYTGEHFDVGAQDITPRGIMWDGVNFWIVGGGNDEVYKYYANGTYTGEHFDVGAQDTNPLDITWDSVNFWVVGSTNDEVYKYYVNGTYTGEHFDVGAQDTIPRGITWDGVNFWIVGASNYKAYKYYANGIYTGKYFNVGAQDTNPYGIIWDDVNFWVLGFNSWKVYKYKISDYTIGDNLISEQVLIESGIESDKWEFLYKGANDKFENGDDNPNGWVDQEDGEDDVNVRTGGTGYVELYAMSGEALALKRESLGYTGDILLNVSFGFEIKYIYSVVHNDVYLKIYSSDDTEIVRIRIYNTGELKYWVSGTTYTQLDTGFVIDTDYDVNLFVNYNNDTCTLRYSTNGVFTNSFQFPLTTTGKSGLNKVEFGICADTDYCQVYLDYIGIYVDYRSISTEFAYHKVIPSTIIDWYFDYANLLRYNAKGNISIHMYVQNYGGSFAQLSGLTEVDGWKTINLYSLKVGGFPFGIAPISLYFFFKGLIELNEVDVHGVVLKQDVNEYHAICDYEGVNQHTSYFYIENNKLYFTITQDDNDSEYIRITFDVDNVLTQNYSINYNAQLTGNSLGYLTVKYTDSTLTPLSLKTYSSGINLILPQDKEINEFNVLITDNDKDSIQGTTTGYVSFVKLIYIPDIAINIIISALFEILIPLLILIIPTFLFYLRLGKAAIIPVFVLMSFICFITDLIPLWVFFVILISSGAFLILDKTVLKEVKD